VQKQVVFNGKTTCFQRKNNLFSIRKQMKTKMIAEKKVLELLKLLTPFLGTTNEDSICTSIAK